MKKIIWNNSTSSGLCDRLIDLHLMSTFSKFLNADLFLDWKECANPNEFQMRTWPKVRYSDYKIENFLRYFHINNNINFVTNLNFNFQNECTIFPHYLGGIYSPKTFYEKYCATLCTYKEFEKEFYNSVSQFKPKQKLKDLINNTEDIDISVHLRRTDKICENPDFGQIHSNELKKLENNTIKCFLTEKIKINKKPKIFVCSDDDECRERFIFDNCQDCEVVKYNNLQHDYEKTYLDLYIMSISNTIIMSQKHSNFSIFSSMINEKKLIYFFEDNDIIKNGNFKNYFYFK